MKSYLKSNMFKKLSFLFFAIFIVQISYTQSSKYEDLLKDKHFNGAVLIATDGIIDYVNCFGVADYQNQLKNNINSKFKIASVTKTFTAVLIMNLVEENKLDLNAPIQKYIPTYSGPGLKTVKVHHLLTYSSGIKNMLDNLGLKPYQTKVSLDEFIEKYCSAELINIPGEKYIYGNTEYIILHKIIENVTQKSFEEYLNEVILVPLKMNNTGIIDSEKSMNGLVKSYYFNRELGHLENEEFYFGELYFGSANMYSTVEDLLKFDQGLFKYQILNKESTDKLLTVNYNLGNTAFGLWGSTGWQKINESFYYRTGGILGSNANWIHTMETKKTIILLSNTNQNDLYKLSEDLYLLSIGK